MTQRRAVISGGTGFVGRFIVERLLADGFAVTVLGRTPPAPTFFSHPVEFLGVSLGAPEIAPGIFAGAAAFIHAAFDHLPGKYRGGEGDDAEGFRRRNLDGSIALFEAAKAAGVGDVVFLSSRAVYGTRAAGLSLSEATEPQPDTLYGTVKLAAERHLLEMAGGGPRPTVLRVTGVYGPAGPGKQHKWQTLFETFLAGDDIVPRTAGEVHGDDVAGAVALLLSRPAPPAAGPILNVSDLAVDRHDLLAIVRAATGSNMRLPARAAAGELNLMSTDRLRRLGWRPGGRGLLEKTVARMAMELVG